MIVYVVWNALEEYVVAVFSTREKAEDFMARREKGEIESDRSTHWDRLEEFTLDMEVVGA